MRSAVSGQALTELSMWMGLVCGVLSLAFGLGVTAVREIECEVRFFQLTRAVRNLHSPHAPNDQLVRTTFCPLGPFEVRMRDL